MHYLAICWLCTLTAVDNRPPLAPPAPQFLGEQKDSPQSWGAGGGREASAQILFEHKVEVLQKSCLTSELPQSNMLIKITNAF